MRTPSRRPTRADRPTPGPRPRCLASVLAGVLVGGLLAMPVVAQPFTRTIASGDTVVVPRTSVYSLPAAESLRIANGGELQGRGALIGLNGTVQVDGRLRAYTGSENATAVGIGGALTSSATGLLEITHLTVQAGGSVWSGGSLLIGGFRLLPTDPLTTVCAFAVPCPGTGLQIDGGGSLVVAAGSAALNYGDVQVSGIFENAGQFTSRNSTNTTGGVPYQQTLTVGRDPVFGGGSGLLINRDNLVLQQNNRLVNHSQVLNGGLFDLAGGRLEQGATGRLTNRGELLVRDGAQLVMQGAQGYQSNGAILPALYSAGSITVDGGGTVHNTWVTQVVHESATASLAIGATGSFTQGSGAVLAMVGGHLQVQGTLSGGSITLDPVAGVTGSVTIGKGGTVEVESYVQTDGTLTVNGTLTGFVQLDGGDLKGGGVGARINGDVLLAGAGGGPPQSPPLCGNAFYACFRPGNSPGHLDINGTLTMGAHSILELEIQRDATGQLHWDSVSATSMHLDGALLRLLVADGAAGADWTTLDLLQCGSDCSFNVAGVELIGTPGAGLLQFSGNSLSFALAPVPEPASGLLLAAGLGWLAWRRRAPARSQSASSGA